MLIETMKQLHTELGPIKYAIVGSLNLKLHGIPNITPNDIDLVMENADLYKIADMFSNNRIKIAETHVSLYFWFNGHKIHVSANLSDAYDIYVSKLQSTSLDIIQNLPCFPLLAELQAYRETHREEKCALIEKYLKI